MVERYGGINQKCTMGFLYALSPDPPHTSHTPHCGEFFGPATQQNTEKRFVLWLSINNNNTHHSKKVEGLMK